MQIVTFPLFSQFPDVVVGISTRQFGSIKEKGEVFEEPLRNFLKNLGLPNTPVVFARQVHGADVAVVGKPTKEVIEGIDGLVSDRKNLLIGMVTADCLPVVFYNPVKKIVGVAHAGYKGILAGIIEEMIETFTKLGSETKDLYVGIGPGIGVCCYNTSKERIDMFVSRFPTFKDMYRQQDGMYFLDLKNTARQILVSHDIVEKQIEILPICTKDSLDRFFSFRGDSNETFGEFATVIGMI